MDENFIVVLSAGVFFVDVENGNQIKTTTDRSRAARLERALAGTFCRRLQLRGWRQATVEPFDGPAVNPNADAEAERIRKFWTQPIE